VSMSRSKAIQLGGALSAVAALFYCVYTRSFDGVGIVILLVFFAYFYNLSYLSYRGGTSFSECGRRTAVPLRALLIP
jgi:hypothetical protein